MVRRTIFLLGALLLLGIAHAQDDINEGIDIEATAGDSDSSDTGSTGDSIPYSTPEISGNFYESFDDESAFNSRWVKSSLTKDGSNEFKYDGEWSRVEAHQQTPGTVFFLLFYLSLISPCDFFSLFLFFICLWLCLVLCSFNTYLLLLLLFAFLCLLFSFSLFS